MKSTAFRKFNHGTKLGRLNGTRLGGILLSAKWSQDRVLAEGVLALLGRKAHTRPWRAHWHRAFRVAGPIGIYVTSETGRNHQQGLGEGSRPGYHSAAICART